MKTLVNILKHLACSVLQPAYSTLKTTHRILPTAHCQLKTALCLLLYCQLSTAQVYPVRVNTQLLPPYSLKLSDYATMMSEKLIVQTLMIDVREMSRQVRFRFSIKGNGLSIRSNDFVIGASPVYIDGGVPLRLSNLDLRPYFEFRNLSGITPQQYNSPLPDGQYQFCFEVFDWISGRRLSSPKLGCFNAFLIINDPPFLNLPRRGDLVEVKNPQNILFNWTPRHLNAGGVRYEFELREIWDTRIDPRAAFLASPNLYSTTTFNTTLLYGPGETPLLENKTYGWRVRAVVTDGISETSVFRNNGYSEIYYFTYTADCQSPQYALAKSLSSSSEEITWMPNSEHKRYKVQYRKVSYTKETDRQRRQRERQNKRRIAKGKSPKAYTPKKENHEWFEVNALNPQARIYNLEPGTTYEYRVGGQCMLPIATQEPQYSYGDIQEFTTPAKTQDSYYNCGIAPEITITNRKPLDQIGVNEVFTAGDFPVTIKAVEGQGGIFSGIGYIVVPYLRDTKIAVEFNNIRINTDYRLYQGSLYTTYDPSWQNVEDIGDELDAIAELPQLIGNLISDLFEKRKEKLLELQELQGDLTNEVISQEEFDKKAEELVIDIKAIDDQLNEAVAERIIDSEFATEEEKKEAKELLQSKGLVDTNTDFPKALENQKYIDKRINEIALAVEKRANEDLLYNLLLALQSQDGKAFLKCKDCKTAPSQGNEIIEGRRFVSIRSLMTEGNAYKYFKCILGSIKDDGTILPKKFEREKLSLEKKKALREELYQEFSTLSGLINTDNKDAFLLVSQSDGNLLECTTPLSFEGDYCSTEQVSDQEIINLTRELEQCAAVDITDTHSILTSLQGQLRKNQSVEWVVRGKVYKLNEVGQVEAVENALTDTQIDNGEWAQKDIDQIFRLYRQESGILQFKAVGIRSDLSIVEGKTADLPSLSKNIKDKGNAFLDDFQVKNIDDTPEKKGVTLESDEFADGEKIAIKEDVSFFKIIFEGSAKMGTLLKTGAIEESTYLESTQETEVVHAPGLVTGSIEAATRAVTDITGAVVLVYDIAVDTKVTQDILDNLQKIKDQIRDDPAKLFPLLTDIALEELTGNSKEAWEQTLNSATDKGKRGHILTKGSVRTVLTVFTSGKLITALPKMADELAVKLLDAKLWDKFKKADGFAPQMLQAFKKNLNELLETIPKASESLLKIADFASAKELAELVSKMNKLKEVPGLDKVIADMGKHRNTVRGGQFQLDYAEKLFNSGKKISFEVIDLSKNLKRVYDITFEVFENGRVIEKRLELKNWNSFFPSTIKSQLVRDLVKMEELGEIQWVFNKTNNIPDMSALKSKILKSLKKADGSPIDELVNSLDDNKVKQLFPNDGLINNSNYAKRLLKNIESDEIFEQIFEITE